MTTTRPRPTTAATALTLALAALPVLTGCGGERAVTTPDTPATSSPATASAPSSTSSTSTSTATSPSPPEPGSTSSASPTGNPGSTAPPTGPAVTPCAAATASVAASPDPGSAGAGHYSLRLTVTNTARSSCTLRGYPGVSVVDAAGRQLGRAADRAPGDTPTVTVPPGGTASTIVRVTQAGNYPTCTTATGAGLRVYLPGERAALLAADTSIVACSDETTPSLLVVSAFH